MTAKSGVDPNRILPIVNSSSRKSLLVNFIGSLLNRNDKVSSLVQQGFKTIIGNGLNSDFWSDDWIRRGVLKEVFPRIYELIVVQQGFVVNFGHWDQDV